MVWRSSPGGWMHGQVIRPNGLLGRALPPAATRPLPTCRSTPSPWKRVHLR